MAKLNFYFFTFSILLFNNGFAQRAPDIIFENLCFGDATEIYLYNRAAYDINWDFGDPVTGANNTSTDRDPTHVFSAPGSYNITATCKITVVGGPLSAPIYSTVNITYSETVTIYPVPVVETLVELVQCENDLDGFSQFNLNEVVHKISENASNEIFTFYGLEADAISGVNAIPNSISYTNTIPSMDTVWARVENVNGCFRTSQVNLTVTTTQIPTTYSRNLYGCDGLDGDNTNGLSVFDFSSVHDEILNMLPNPQDLEINYYTSESDAFSESNPIEDISNYSNTNSPYNQDIYVRIDNKIYNDCVGLGKHITLTVNPSPEFYIEPRQVLCNTDPVSTIVLEPYENNPLETFTYSWTLNGTEISVSPTLSVSTPGIYSITLTKTDGTGCSRTMEVSVIGSEIAKITQNDIAIVDITENNSITIKNPNNLGPGDYWFALESEDGTVSFPYQTETIFNNLKGGFYTLFVEDKNGCGTATLPISVIGYPKFFTPNNDGINDFWQIQGIDALIQPESSIHIFNRYGKLLKQLSPAEIGWNGTFNGLTLSTDDYWFKILLQDGRTVMGHFTLKR
jgi:gliding motility-associated-like protein